MNFPLSGLGSKGSFPSFFSSCFSSVLFSSFTSASAAVSSLLSFFFPRVYSSSGGSGLGGLPGLTLIESLSLPSSGDA